MMGPSDCLLSMWLNKDDCLVARWPCKDDTCWATGRTRAVGPGRCEQCERSQRAQARQRGQKNKKDALKDHPQGAGSGTAPRLPRVLLYCMQCGTYAV